jgi:hypothetical protein
MERVRDRICMADFSGTVIIKGADYEFECGL